VEEGSLTATLRFSYPEHGQDDQRINKGKLRSRMANYKKQFSPAPAGSVIFEGIL
jgi:hypothetical protein